MMTAEVVAGPKLNPMSMLPLTVKTQRAAADVFESTALHDHVLCHAAKWASVSILDKASAMQLTSLSSTTP